jgi:diaminohydroxyphosphoribosylaminopyrimidine deaminase/5-amino-6-(5-phosphoribosylamino)uracil reductase
MKNSPSDERFMRLALRLARKGEGMTSPNPMVGAVLVKGGAIVGTGYHHRAGEPHAEILALRRAGEKAKGATLYLNLEPCDHFGRTAPCTRAILKAGVQRVVAGMKDPNPLVSGRGIKRLKEAGVRVEVGVCKEACQELNAAFVKGMTSGTPWVILKAALSLDGKSATRSGDSRWISSGASRRQVHRLRRRVDAVMVGIGTVRRDDPLLNIRLPGRRTARQPLRVVIDSRLRIPLASRIVRTAEDFPTLVVTTPAAPVDKRQRLKKAGVKVLVTRADRRGRVKLRPLMRALRHLGIQSVLLEGGPALNAGALEERIVDRILLFVAPKIIGGREAPGMAGGEGVWRMKSARRAEILRVRRIGPDLMIEAKPLYG